MPQFPPLQRWEGDRKYGQIQTSLVALQPAFIPSYQKRSLSNVPLDTAQLPFPSPVTSAQPSSAWSQPHPITTSSPVLSLHKLPPGSLGPEKSVAIINEQPPRTPIPDVDSESPAQRTPVEDNRTMGQARDRGM